MNYRNRSGSFALACVAIGLHLHQQGYGAMAFVLLVLQFIAYPQLVYRHSRRAPDPKQAEFRAVLLDAGLFGVWAAALGFALWITVLLLVSVTISHTAFCGLRRLPRVWGVIAAGVVLGGMTAGWRFEPNTSAAVTALCIAGLTFYLLIVAQGAYARAIALHGAREQLRRSEQALQAANQRLHRQLDDIHALETRLRDQAERDPLTGLYNRRYFDAAMAREIARCLRERQPISLMLIDLDHFKRINDNHGHQAGDAVLDQLAALLRSQARSSDVVCRYGGEEFVLLMPGMPLAAALARAEACRAAFARERVDYGGVQLAATLSVGVASCDDDAGDSPRQLLRRADEALYEAKGAGRNRVAAAGARRETAAG